MMKFLLLIPILLLATTNISAQRCGDSLFIYLRDQNGQVMAPSAFESVKVSATYTVDNVTNLVDAEPKISELAHGIRSFAVRAECGMKVAQFQLKYKGDVMTIRVLNVPGDALHILLEGISFRKGTFEVDWNICQPNLMSATVIRIAPSIMIRPRSLECSVATTGRKNLS
jgi:hypothetical protein